MRQKLLYKKEPFRNQTCIDQGIKLTLKIIGKHEMILMMIQYMLRSLKNTEQYVSSLGRILKVAHQGQRFE